MLPQNPHAVLSLRRCCRHNHSHAVLQSLLDPLHDARPRRLVPVPAGGVPTQQVLGGQVGWPGPGGLQLATWSLGPWGSVAVLSGFQQIQDGVQCPCGPHPLSAGHATTNCTTLPAGFGSPAPENREPGSLGL